MNRIQCVLARWLMVVEQNVTRCQARLMVSTDWALGFLRPRQAGPTADDRQNAKRAVSTQLRRDRPSWYRVNHVVSHTKGFLR
jgi:hypothetical protein